MKVLLAIFICFASTINLPAQSYQTQMPSSAFEPDSIQQPKVLPGTVSGFFLPKKLNTGIQFGTFLSTTSGYGSSFSTYVTPGISYNLSNRFRINAGISIVNTTLYGIKPFYAGQESALNGNFTHALLTVSGDYLINERLQISGALFKEVDLFNSVPGSYPYRHSTPEGGFMKVGYKVHENFHIEAGFGYSKGINPYQDYFGSPFSPNPFPY